jgi:hypothetical protein
VQISEDFKKVVFCYGYLNYLCEEKYEGGGYHQQELNFIKGKYVQKIKPVGSDFFIICCKNYDKDLDIYCTKPEWMNKLRHYKLSIDRRIEPNSIRVFDCEIE